MVPIIERPSQRAKKRGVSHISSAAERLAPEPVVKRRGRGKGRVGSRDSVVPRCAKMPPCWPERSRQRTNVSPGGDAVIPSHLVWASKMGHVVG